MTIEPAKSDDPHHYLVRSVGGRDVRSGRSSWVASAAATASGRAFRGCRLRGRAPSHRGDDHGRAAIVFRARDLLVRQRTQIINAIRGHLAEFGMVAAKGSFHVAKLVAAIEDNHAGVPAMARPVLRLLAEQLRSLDERVVLLDRELARRAREDAEAKGSRQFPDRADHGDSARCPCAGSSGLQERTRLRGMAGAHAAAALHGRKAEARRDLPHGRAPQWDSSLTRWFA